MRRGGSDEVVFLHVGVQGQRDAHGGVLPGPRRVQLRSGRGVSVCGVHRPSLHLLRCPSAVRHPHPPEVQHQVQGWICVQRRCDSRRSVTSCVRVHGSSPSGCHARAMLRSWCELCYWCLVLMLLH